MKGRPDPETVADPSTSADGLTHEVQIAGKISTKVTARDTSGTGADIHFGSATITVDSVNTGEIWRLLIDGLQVGTDYEAISTSVNTMAAELAARAGVTATGNTFTFTGDGDFTVAIEVVAPEGQASTGTVPATIEGTPVSQPALVSGNITSTSPLTAMSWTEVTIELTGTVHEHEIWSDVNILEKENLAL